MRILLVNAHTNNIEAQRYFQDLLACVKEILKNHNGLLEIKDEYIIRTKDNLDDFLYDETTSFNHASVGKDFDSLDMIIVSGDLHCLPWQSSYAKVLILLKMCVRVKKCLFAVGFAMQALVYLSASNLEHHISVINGNGKGGKLSDMANFDFKPDKIKPDEHFLDNVTGDLYHFQHETNEWAPLCNIGFHCKKTAQEYHKLGKFVVKTPVYRPKKLIQNDGNMDVLDENVETKCYIKKVYINHWLFTDCDMEFIVPYRGRWEIHSFSFTNKDKAFEVLAESGIGSLVIEFPRIIGIKFTANKRYKETYKLLRNFIRKYAAEIISTGKCQDMSILSYTSLKRTQMKYFTYSEKLPGNKVSVRTDNLLNYRAQILDGKKSPTPKSPTRRINTDNDPVVFKHSGLASKMKGKFILEHNFISTGRVHYDFDNHTAAKNGIPLMTRESLMGKYGLTSRRPISPLQSSHNLSEADLQRCFPERSALKHSVLASQKQQPRKHQKKVSIHETPSDTSNFRYTEPDESSLTKENVRRWLYPELDELHQEFDKKAWVPGFLSQSQNSSQQTPKTAIRISTGFPAYRKVGPLAKIKPEDFDKRTVRAADPYLTFTDLKKEYQKKEDEKILGPKKFITSRSSGTEYSIPFLSSSLTKSKLYTITSSRRMDS